MIILSEQGDFWKVYSWKTPIWQQTGLGNESQVLKNLHILRVSKFVMYGYEGRSNVFIPLKKYHCCQLQVGFQRFNTRFYDWDQGKDMLFGRNLTLLCHKTLEQIDFNKTPEIVKTTKYACCEGSEIIEMNEMCHSNCRIWRQDFRFIIVRKSDPGRRRADSDTKNTQFCER